MFFFFQAEDGIRDKLVTGVRRVLFRSGHESRNVRDLGTRGAPDRLAGRDRDEGRRARADLGRRPRSAREQRGQRDLGPGRLSGRGEVRDGCRRVRRGGHRDLRPAQGLVCTRLGTGTSHRSTCWRAEGSPRSPRPEIWRSSSRFAPRKTTSSRSTRTGRSTSTISTRRRGSSSSPAGHTRQRSEEHTSELQSLAYLVCRLLLEKKKKMI